MDIYPVLPYTDVLITDYSSVMYDYILMEKKDVILYLFDKEEYVNERPFIWSFEDMTYGHRASSFETLLELVGNVGLCPDEANKAVLVKKCWGENSLDTCERISSFFKQS